VRPSWVCWMCPIDRLHLPPPSWLTILDVGVLYIYCVLRNNSSVQSVAVTRSRDTLVLTASSSSSSSATSSPFFFLPWERVSWTF
jgi:uncharacterized membrane protein YdbT with pleckstrin-like domain